MVLQGAHEMLRASRYRIMMAQRATMQLALRTCGNISLPRGQDVLRLLVPLFIQTHVEHTGPIMTKDRCGLRRLHRCIANAKPMGP